MKINRKKTRTFLFQKLYSTCFSEDVETGEFYESFFEGVFDFVLDEKYFKEMFSTIIKKEPILLEIIKKYAPKFNVEKMHIMYILPIYIGATEMLFLKEEIPAKVSINESVEIAKVFWDTSSKRIVNWVLNKIFENYDEVVKEIETMDWNSKFSLFKK